MPIHREGKIIIPVAFLILSSLIAMGFYVHAILGGILLLAGIILFVLIVHFFRNPKRIIPSDPNLILSPCDGKVVVIEKIQENRYFQHPVIQVSIFMSPLNVHVNRNPIGGKVIHYTYFPGKYLMAFNPKSSELNEQNLIVVGNERLTVGYKQIAGFMARRIRCYIGEGTAVTQGKEFGFIRFGSRLDLLLPLESEIVVALGDKVRGGIDPIARIAKG